MTTATAKSEAGMDRALSPGARIALALWAFGSTALYALGGTLFADQTMDHGLTRTAIGVAVCAAASWIVLGTVLFMRRRSRTVLTGWFDACLRIMSWGDLALVLGTFAAHLLHAHAGLSWPTYLAAYTLGIVCAGLLMTAMWFRAAARLGTSAGRAALLWFGALQGSFVVLFVLLADATGYSEWLLGGPVFG
ncbi:MAG: hypothetical protein AAGG07_00515 [Planctomycetota bacterium]